MKRLLIALIILAAIGAGLYGGLIWVLTKPAPPLEIGTTISLTQGDISGGVDADDSSIQLFNNIPFAAAPVGDLRWRPPVAAADWAGVRDGRAFGAECIQSREGSAEFYNDLVKGLGLNWITRQLAALAVRNAPPPNESEDCLSLNVRTANLSGSEVQPVMVWIHGGSHQTGAGSNDIYQANGLVENGVVLVTINYRLGALGYLAHPALSADDPRGVSGNYGLLDQVAALEWVRDNIAEFGGDPDNVTIFGESAGAQAVTELMSTELSAGLFHKAILQSGASTYNANGLEAAIDGRMTMHDAGIEYLDGLAAADASAADLRAIPAEQIVAQIQTKSHLGGYLLPVVDGVVITRLMGDAIQNGYIHNVPILAGYNTDEGTLFYDSIQAPTVLKSPFPDDHGEQLSLLDTLYGTTDAAILKSEYNLSDPATYRTGAIDMLGDDIFGVHMRLLGKANAAAGEPTWLYQFGRIPPSKTQTLGAFHAAEIMFVFDSHSPLLKFDQADIALTDAMGKYWTNFARTGNPNETGLTEWPAYEAASDQWLTFSPEVKAASGIRAAKLDVMERALLSRIETAAAVINLPHETLLANSVDQETSADGL